MLKRTVKITSLLVSMASLISIIPVQAADYQKVDTQEGTIYSSLAKGKGIFIDGEINGQDEAVYWISDDGKYNKIDGIETGDSLKDLLLNKYLEINEGGQDFTYVDITDNYKIKDYDVRLDLESTEAQLLKAHIRHDNDGRFDESKYKSAEFTSYYKKEGSANFLSASSGLSLFQIPLKKARLNKETVSSIYSDAQGNYVDADYNLGNLKVYTTTGSSVSIKNTEDTYEIDQNGKTYQLQATIKENKEITDISDNVYRFADLTIYKKEKGTDDNYAPITAKDGFKFGKDNFAVDGTVTVMQLFSKTAATDAIDGIKYSKNSVIYFIADKDGNKDYLIGKSNSDQSALSKIGATAGGKTKITGNDKGFCSIYLDSTNKKIYAETFTLKAKNGFNYLDIGDHDSSDVVSADSIYTAGGSAWFINDGYIENWDGDKHFKKLYRVDGSMSNFSVSSKDNMIAWNEDSKGYSVIHNVATKTDATTKTTATTTTTTTGAAVTVGTTDTTAVGTKTTTGWVLGQNNTWNYVLENGTKKTGWLKDNGSWYYLKADGIMATGWANDNSTWYYLNGSGAMKTGWINDGNAWYYCDASGAMLYNTTIDGYVLGTNGAWIK